VKAVVQRVESARVDVDGRPVAAIDRGLLVLVGLETGDAAADREWMADKIAHLRVFEDAAGKMNLAAGQLDPPGGLLLVPNFTVAGDCRRGRRPSFDGAMPPAQAEPEFAAVVAAVATAAGPSVRVCAGVFRAPMRVVLTNDGPVTLLLDSRSC
jgi:D-tyrosyl-tRNA(Tyr) deacylase